MELEEFKEAEKKAKKKTRFFLIIGLSIWMFFLFFFLNQSKNEQSLIFAKILPTGLIIKPITIIDDTSKIDPNIDPNIFIVDTTNIDTTIKKGKSYSLRPYAPKVMSQGQLGSCVSWASAYAGLTIVKRIEKNNKNLEPFSPLNLYVRYKKHFNEDPCSYGACVPFALNILKSNGCSPYNKFLPNECSKNVSENMVYDDKLYSFDPLNSSSISSIKSAIANNMPVVIGIKCYDGDDWKNAIFNNGVWSGYFTGSVNSGHAMCLIGYDDEKAGGAFEILNSWGEDWGDKGYFWIKYADFVKHVDECYALIPQKVK
jgi:C1A family cysteine protease